MRMRPRSPASSAPCRAPRRSFGTRAPSTSAPPRLCLAGGTASCDSSFFLPTPSPRTAHVHPSPSHTHTHAHARPGSHTHREHEHAHTRAHTRAHTHTRTRTNAHTARQHARAHTKTERAPPPRQGRGGCTAPLQGEASGTIFLHSHTHAHQRPHCTPARTRAHKDGASSAAAPGAWRVHGPLARQGIRHHLSLKHLRWVFLCRTFVGCGVSLQHLCRVFCLRGRFLLPCFFSAFWFCFPNEVNKAAGRYFIAFLLSGLQSTLTR